MTSRLCQNEAREDFSIVLGEDEYLVLGDNRYSSHDSRDEDIGTLPKSAFVGRVLRHRVSLFPRGRPLAAQQAIKEKVRI